MTARLRFASESLHQRFVAELVSANVAFTIAETGDVQYSESTRTRVMAIARLVRDTCFEWYLMWLQTPAATARFRELLDSSAMRFEIEHQLENDAERVVFLLPKADHRQHERVWRDAVRRHEPAFLDTGRAFVGLSDGLASADRHRSFPAQELSPFADHVAADDLVVGETYFQLGFVDFELLVPQLTALVFIGRDLGQGDAGRLYFQDAASFNDGVPHDDETPDVCTVAITTPFVQTFEQALNELLKCAPRRVRSE